MYILKNTYFCTKYKEMRKYIIYITVLFLFGCVKDLEDISPKSQNIPHKNYLLPSYDLQKSKVKIDIMELRKNKTGIESPWNLLPVAFLDVNGDGDDDIFYVPSYGDTSRTSGQLFIYKNGNYVLDNSYFNTIPSLVNARKVLVGDYNNDKIPDMFITGHGYDLPPFPGEYTELLLSNSNKKYDLIKFSDKIGFYHGACSGDIDNDGDLDIFVVDKTNSYFLINDGKGKFTYSTNQIDITKLNGYGICEFIDVNKDGYLDLLIGGGEPYNPTRIFWGSSSFKFEINNVTDIPPIDNFGSITDIDVFDLDNDGSMEIAITRTGFKNFYNGWYIQIVKISSKRVTDFTTTFIDQYSYEPKTPNNQEWIPWMRFEDYDDDGKIDFFSTRCTPAPFVRWELNDGKLIKIN